MVVTTRAAGRGPCRRAPLAAVLAATLAAATGCTSAAAGPADADGPPSAGPQAVVIAAQERRDAPELSGADLRGGRAGLAPLRGRVVVLNVWGSWCGPCRTEAAGLEAVHRETEGQGVRFLGINTRDRDREAARAFEERYELTYPSLHDPRGDLLLRFPEGTLNPQAVPSTLLLDRRGRVAASIAGPVTPAELRPLIARLAGEPE
ncbi:TlpA disulfide reductase family protein [Streptomyces sp. NBC_01565]|uniref:TlpA family protein disulfide reductase n=1 Tax=Streptomyces sp. NBC_01565 TaxID=2975881 RepID=UPI002257D029|nr:TlpA disulfide reductase family protein [Streptomyces sp. NBC_01565]MCX4539839.1 TlpA family protein disulfide reductase [Streptomyces sp. NBC_01565]